MNPETRLTDSQLKAICAKHGISYRSHTRLTTGFTHELHHINDDMVIKIFNHSDESDTRKFNTEASLLASKEWTLKPELILRDDDQDLIDRSYLIMTFIPGFSLGSVWYTATDEQREEVVASISESMRTITKLDPNEIGLQANENWENTIGIRCEKYLTYLLDKNIVNSKVSGNVRDYLKILLPALDRSVLFPVYWDVHLDNFIVDEAYKLRALIDFENVELSPLDYPLFVVRKMMDEPEKYFSEEDYGHINKKDYENLWGWYQKYYPEMFDYQNLDARVRLYQILDTLHLLQDWPHVNELHIKLDILTS